jgi:pSer/pThr/pTyr-binding forkhead associated (FHA) protein
VEDQCVSRNHAALVRLGERLFIWDEGSKHGTFINGLQVICGELADGDLLTIGADYSLAVTVSGSRREDRSTALGNAWEHLAATK